MKVLFINCVCGVGSTGRICGEKADELSAAGHECRIAYGRDSFVPDRYKKYAVRIGGDLDVRLHAASARLFDNAGFMSRRATKRFLEWAREFDPDEIHLHNLHGYYINVELLFEYLKSVDKTVTWTLHDCWPFTGHCAHFTIAGCDKWKTRCENCPQKGAYPASVLCDASRRNFDKKKELFRGVKNMTLVAPSEWIAGLAKQSFLSEYPVRVEHNRINTDVFKPTPSDFRKKHGLADKKIVLGVSGVWSKEKGLDDFVSLSRMLDDRYKVVLVGLTEAQKNALPNSVLGVVRTESAEELAGIYTTADVFLNLTYEDNYPTVNLEAKACGAPVVTYRTGGSPESVPPENVVEPGDLSAVVSRVTEITETADR